jgi:hypothetical protein
MWALRLLIPRKENEPLASLEIAEGAEEIKIRFLSQRAGIQISEFAFLGVLCELERSGRFIISALLDANDSW